MKKLIQVDMQDTIGPVVWSVVEALGPEGRRRLNEAGARAALEAVRGYHREFAGIGGWSREGKPGRRGGFGEAVAEAWKVESVDDRGAVLSNDAPFLAQKVEGGVIRARSVRALTVPLVREARGLRAREYERAFDVRLFTVPGKRVLFEKGDGKKLRAVYALAGAVTQKPWKGALPEDDVVVEAFVRGWGALLEL